MKFACTILNIGKVNKNNRIYDQACADQILSSDSQKRLGYLRGKGFQDILNLQLLASKIENITQVDDTLVADVLLLDTPSGLRAKELIDSGVKLGCRACGIGQTTKNDEGHDVVYDYKVEYFQIHPEEDLS